MSGFDENPFGDPTIDNPFADPSVQQVAKNTSSMQRGLDDYNPFADQPGSQPPTGTMAANQPAIMQPSSDPPQYSRSAQQTVPTGTIPSSATAAEFQRRQEELERKAQELARREEELRSGAYNVRRNNWPPLPAQCPFQPCFYQDIEVDIPLEFQKIVRHLYYLWMFHAGLMVLNVLGGILLIFKSGEFTVFGLGIIYGAIFVPLSFLCWFRPAYKAFRSDSSFNFMVFFFIFFFQFIVTLVQFIGMRDSGFCGLITALTHFEKSASGIIIGTILLTIAFGFGSAALLDILLLGKIHRMYRSTGASFAKAQQEFATEFLKNQHVQNVATNAAAAAVQTQFSQGNRY
ncbi:secretory carrier-associated membrane protein 1 isoform X2 [Chrysoperla carnea]|uniref:secretory carrier-associated membrane protein 1 isoform X2 n=1 Tax=Chrysoperla carnea TaxID=189513 RepID=UPI001D093568|nr:secretory carrier-associated membrane protein 1 isoform X2 [Chrysoperla carnea]